MSSDLIFHIVSRRKWHSLTQNGFYKPEEFDEETGIECVNSNQLQPYLNDHFNGRKNLLLLVIDKYRLLYPLKKDKDTNLIYVPNGINVDAILDKIRLDCGKDGLFDVNIETE